MVPYKCRQTMREAAARRAERMAEQGMLLMDEVEGYLSNLEKEGKISNYRRHTQNSYNDRRGKDFTVSAMVNGETIERSFGVTISLKSWVRAKALHPDVPQFCFPLGTKRETMEKRILDLFKEEMRIVAPVEA